MLAFSRMVPYNLNISTSGISGEEDSDDECEYGDIPTPQLTPVPATSTAAVADDAAASVTVISAVGGGVTLEKGEASDARRGRERGQKKRGGVAKFGDEQQQQPQQRARGEQAGRGRADEEREGGEKKEEEGEEGGKGEEKGEREEKRDRGVGGEGVEETKTQRTTHKTMTPTETLPPMTSTMSSIPTMHARTSAEGGDGLGVVCGVEERASGKDAKKQNPEEGRVDERWGEPGAGGKLVIEGGRIELSDGEEGPIKVEQTDAVGEHAQRLLSAREPRGGEGGTLLARQAAQRTEQEFGAVDFHGGDGGGGDGGGGVDGVDVGVVVDVGVLVGVGVGVDVVVGESNGIELTKSPRTGASLVDPSPECQRDGDPEETPPPVSASAASLGTASASTASADAAGIRTGGEREVAARSIGFSQPEDERPETPGCEVARAMELLANRPAAEQRGWGGRGTVPLLSDEKSSSGSGTDADVVLFLAEESTAAGSEAEMGAPVGVEVETVAISETTIADAKALERDAGEGGDEDISRTGSGLAELWQADAGCSAEPRQPVGSVGGCDGTGGNGQGGGGDGNPQRNRGGGATAGGEGVAVGSDTAVGRRGLGKRQQSTIFETSGFLLGQDFPPHPPSPSLLDAAGGGKVLPPLGRSDRSVQPTPHNKPEVWCRKWYMLRRGKLSAFSGWGVGHSCVGRLPLYGCSVEDAPEVSPAGEAPFAFRVRARWVNAIRGAADVDGPLSPPGSPTESQKAAFYPAGDDVDAPLLSHNGGDHAASTTSDGGSFRRNGLRSQLSKSSLTASRARGRRAAAVGGAAAVEEKGGGEGEEEFELGRRMVEAENDEELTLDKSCVFQ
eukprot:jgi/Undpi1/9475/HiC_scaffold_27.g11931.m1